MRILAGGLMLLVLSQSVVGTQAPQTFEVVSIRPRERGESLRPSSRLTATRFELASVSPRNLVERAFNVRPFQIDGPTWATTERFSIRAVLPAGAVAGDIPGMLQMLLVERFKFKMHVEARPADVYELVAEPSGTKLREVEPVNELGKAFPGATVDSVSGLPDDELREILSSGDYNYRAITSRTSYAYKLLPPSGAMQLDAERITMAEFVGLLAVTVDRPILDRTGLNGIYQLKTVLPPRRLSSSMQALLGERRPTDPSGVDLSRSLKDLGLKLEPKTSALDFVVIDTIERPSPD